MIRWLLLAAVAAHAQTVQGIAVNSVTHKPVAGALVQLIGTAEDGESDTYRGKSNAAGQFHFEGVMPGKYRIIADAAGYTRFGSAGKRLTIAPGAAVPDQTLEMIPASVIAGHVLDQDGDPLPYASVEALQYGYQSGKKTLQRLSSARTDDRGEYRLFGLAPGRYYVRASLRSGPTAAYAPLFFPGAREVEQATLVEAASSSDARSFDIILRPEELHSISGRVVDSQTGQAAANVYVTAGTSDGFANGGPQVADTFSIHGLPAGKYVLYAQDYSGGASKSARQTVELGNADLNGVLLTLNPGLDISGTIRSSAGLPDDAAKMQLSLQSDDNSMASPVSSKGSFAFHHVRPDRYHLIWSMPKGFYVKSIKMGDRRLTDDALDLTGAVAPLAIEVATDGGQVQGVVRNSKGEPVEGAAVTLTTSPSYDVWSATTDQNGQYEIRDIAPGDYKLIAFDGAPEGAPGDPDFRKPYEKSAVDVQVLPSTRQKMDLTAVTVQ